MGWWTGKIRRTRRYLRPRVSDSECASLSNWARPREVALFGAMPAGDQRHGLDVLAALRQMGAIDRDLLVAGLIHDCGKGRRVRLPHRVVWSLGEHYGEWLWRLARPLPTFGYAITKLRHHAEISARMADEAGCSKRTVELIRLQENPVDEEGQMLHAADEAN